MLRKKYHVVRKKNHVVRKIFYVASIFDGGAGRQGSLLSATRRQQTGVPITPYPSHYMLHHLLRTDYQNQPLLPRVPVLPVLAALAAGIASAWTWAASFEAAAWGVGAAVCALAAACTLLPRWRHLTAACTTALTLLAAALAGGLLAGVLAGSRRGRSKKGKRVNHASRFK